MILEPSTGACCLMCQPFGLSGPNWIQVSGAYRPRQRVCQPFGLENIRVFCFMRRGEPGLTQTRKEDRQFSFSSQPKAYQSPFQCLTQWCHEDDRQFSFSSQPEAYQDSIPVSDAVVPRRGQAVFRLAVSRRRTRIRFRWLMQWCHEEDRGSFELQHASCSLSAVLN